MRNPSLLVPAVLFFLVACGSSGTLDGDRARPVDPNQLTSADMVHRDHDNVFEAVRALRPNWLRPRGRVSLTRTAAGDVVIYMDGTRVGGPEYLRRVPVNDVSVLRYLNASAATNRFGTGHAGGVIMVTTRTM